MRSDADEHASEQAAEQKGPGDSEYATRRDEARGLRDDKAEQTPAGCAKGEANAHLLRALGDGVGEDAVDADCGEDDRERGEAGDEQHDEAALCDLAGDALVHGLDVEDGLLAIDGEDSPPHSVGEERGVGGTAERDVDFV